MADVANKSEMAHLTVEGDEEIVLAPVERTLSLSNDGGAREITKPTACRSSLVLLAVVPAVLGLVVWGEVAVWTSGGTPRRHGAPRFAALPVAAAPARTLMESPELVGLVVDQVYSVHNDDVGMPKDRLHRGVGQLLSQFGEVLDHTLSSSQKLALRDAHIDADTWEDLRKVLQALRNGTVVGLGRHVFETIANASSTPEDIQSLVTTDLRGRAPELTGLKDALIPGRFNDRENTPSKTLNLWKGLLSPEVMQEMQQKEPHQTVNQSDVVGFTRHGQGSLAHHVTYLKQRIREQRSRGGAIQNQAAATARPVQRRLTEDKDTFLSPQLDWIEFSFSIAGVSLVLVLEILMHLSLMTTGFSMPDWCWYMIVVPTDGISVATCMFGLSIWCDVILGAIGVNLLEAPFMPLMPGLGDNGGGPNNPYRATGHRVR